MTGRSPTSDPGRRYDDRRSGSLRDYDVRDAAGRLIDTIEARGHADARRILSRDHGMAASSMTLIDSETDEEL